MALQPGDAVPKDDCVPVGNFPFGILTDPDALRLDPGVQGPVPALASNKADYITLFEDRDLEICNEDIFATSDTPLLLSLKNIEEEDPGPDDPEVGEERYINVYSSGGSYVVSTYGHFGQYSDKWTYAYFQSGPWRNDRSTGTLHFDMVGGPEVTGGDVILGPWGSFYANTTFICTADIVYTVSGINGDRFDDIILVVDSTFTYANDNGAATYTNHQVSPRGRPAIRAAFGVYQDQVPWIGRGGESGFLTKTGAFSTQIEVRVKLPDYENDISF